MTTGKRKLLLLDELGERPGEVAAGVGAAAGDGAVEALKVTVLLPSLGADETGAILSAGAALTGTVVMGADVIGAVEVGSGATVSPAGADVTGAFVSGKAKGAFV